MSDWARPRPSPVRIVVTIAVVAACAAAMFMAGRWSAPQSEVAAEPAGVQVDRSEDQATSSLTPPRADQPGWMLQTDGNGLPFGYDQTEAGARAAAINLLVAGLLLRSMSAHTKLHTLLGDDRPERTKMSPAVKGLVEQTSQLCAVVDGKPVCPDDPYADQAAAYDFAPAVEEAGPITSAQVVFEPVVEMQDASHASVTLVWREHRAGLSGAAEPSTIASQFTIRLWYGDDWRLYPDGVDAEPAGELPPAAWLDVLGFVGQR